MYPKFSRLERIAWLCDGERLGPLFNSTIGAKERVFQTNTHLLPSKLSGFVIYPAESHVAVYFFHCPLRYSRRFTDVQLFGFRFAVILCYFRIFHLRLCYCGFLTMTRHPGPGHQHCFP